MANINIQISDVNVDILSNENSETLSADSENDPGDSTEAARIDHTHAIEASDSPGVSSKILKTSIAGLLGAITGLGIGTAASSLFGIVMSYTKKFGIIDGFSNTLFEISVIDAINSLNGMVRLSGLNKSKAATGLDLQCQGSENLIGTLALSATSGVSARVGIALCCSAAYSYIKIGENTNDIDFVSFES